MECNACKPSWKGKNWKPRSKTVAVLPITVMRNALTFANLVFYLIWQSHTITCGLLYGCIEFVCVWNFQFCSSGQILWADLVAALRPEEEKQCWGVGRSPRPASGGLARVWTAGNPVHLWSCVFWGAPLVCVATDQCLISHERIIFPLFVKESRLETKSLMQKLLYD